MAETRPPDDNEDAQADERWSQEGGAAGRAESEDPHRTRREKAWDDARDRHWHGATSTDETQARAEEQRRDAEPPRDEPGGP